MRMSFEFYFIRYWLRVFLAIVLVCACAAWLWIPTVMITVTLFIPVVAGGIAGAYKIYKIITEPTCTCCKLMREKYNEGETNDCDCEVHCYLHRPKLPQLTIRRMPR